MLLRASGLGVGTGTPPGGRLMFDKDMLGAWRELNATERYFTLLESWLVQASPEILAERCGWSSASAVRRRNGGIMVVGPVRSVPQLG